MNSLHLIKRNLLYTSPCKGLLRRCANFTCDEHRHFHFVRRALSVCAAAQLWWAHHKYWSAIHSWCTPRDKTKKYIHDVHAVCMYTHSTYISTQHKAAPCTYLMLYKCAVERAARLDGKCCCWWNKIPVCVCMHVYVARPPARTASASSPAAERYIYRAQRERGKRNLFHGNFKLLCSSGSSLHARVEIYWLHMWESRNSTGALNMVHSMEMGWNKAFFTLAAKWFNTLAMNIVFWSPCFCFELYIYGHSCESFLPSIFIDVVCRN
jgi:hypothetical protein